MSNTDLIIYNGINELQPLAIPRALTGFQIGLAPVVNEGVIFLDHVAPPCDHYRLPGGTIANWARCSMPSNLGWNIDPDHVKPGDPTEALLETQDKMSRGVTPAYSYAAKTALSSGGPGRYALVVNLMFTDSFAVRAEADFKNLTGNPVKAQVRYVEFSNEWWLPNYRGRVLEQDIETEEQAAVERQIIIDRANVVREVISRYCAESNLPIPVFVWPYALREDRGQLFAAHNEAVIQAMQPGDAVAIHDYFIDHWQELGRKDYASDASDFSVLQRAVNAYSYEVFEARFKAIQAELPAGTPLAVNEWSLKTRGAGWKGSIAEAIFTAKYISYLIRFEAEYPGSILAASFQNVYSDTNGPGIYTKQGSAYLLDASGIVLSTLYNFVNLSDSVHVIRARFKSLRDGLSAQVDSGLVHYFGLFCPSSGVRLFIFANASGEDIDIDAKGEGGELVQISGNLPSDYIGPDFPQLGPRDRATFEDSLHDGTFTVKALSVGLFTLKTTQ